MSNNTRTRKTNTTRTTGATGTTRTPRPVPDRNPDTAAVTARTDAEDALWAALHANPDSTSTELSTAAKIAKSTAQKILTRWAGDGTVTRTPGVPDGGRRAADRWAITPDAAGTPADTEQDRVVAPVDDTATAGTPQPTPDTTDTAPADGADPEPTDSAPIATAPADTAPVDPAPVDTEPDTTAADDAPETVAPADAELVAEIAEPMVDGAASDANARLAPGALRGMVEDHLRDHPDKEFSPVDIARKVGGKSSGAVSNALDKLVKDKIAVQTKERPKRFALAPPEASATSA